MVHTCLIGLGPAPIPLMQMALITMERAGNTQVGMYLLVVPQAQINLFLMQSAQDRIANPVVGNRLAVSGSESGNNGTTLKHPDLWVLPIRITQESRSLFL